MAATAPGPGDLAPLFTPWVQAVCVDVGTILIYGAGDLTQSIKSTSCFSRGFGWDSQHPHSLSQEFFLTLVSGDALFCPLQALHRSVTQISMQAKHLYTFNKTGPLKLH